MLYLISYNVFQFIGWLIILLLIILHYVNGGKPETLWPEIGDLVVVFQSLAVLEVQTHLAFFCFFPPLIY